MANPTTKQRQRGLAFANRLAEVAADAPDTVAKSATFKAVNYLREFYGFSDDEKRSIVKNAITLGCSTYQDVITETSFPRQTVEAVVKGLADAGDIEMRQLEHNDGRPGRPQTAFFRPALA